MRSLGAILSGVVRRQEGGESLYAAAAVAATNEALKKYWPSSDANATSVSRGQVIIDVSHSAVAGLIQQHQADILRETNNTIHQRFPAIHQPISRLITRPTR